MGSSLTALSIIQRANEKILNEEFNIHSRGKMVALFNMSVKHIIGLVPSAYTIMAIWQSAVGIRQQIPSVGVELIDLMCNCSDSTTETTPIYPTSLTSMDELDPGWRTLTPQASADNWAKKPNVLDKFFVCPPADGTGYYKGEMVATPPAVVYDAGGLWETVTIPFNNNYAKALETALEWECYNEDRDFPGNMAKAETTLQQLMADLGLKKQEEA